MDFQANDWKVIPEFPDYEIHVNGLVRCISNQAISRSFVGTEAPYLRVHLVKDGVLQNVYVTPLVVELFHKNEVSG